MWAVLDDYLAELGESFRFVDAIDILLMAAFTVRVIAPALAFQKNQTR